MTKSKAQKRWTARVSYRLNKGLSILHHQFDEFAELGEFIESGPHWDTIIGVDIVLNAPDFPALTVESAAKL